MAKEKDIEKFLSAVKNAKDTVPEAVALTIGDLGAKILKKADENGNTALHLAAQNGNIKLVSLILKKTEEFIESQNHNGQTPRDLAAEGRHGRVIEALEKPAKDAAARASAAVMDVAYSSKVAAVSSSKVSTIKDTSSNTYAARTAEKAATQAAMKAKLIEKSVSGKGSWCDTIKNMMPCGSGRGRS